jgi:hypothetical protein
MIKELNDSFKDIITSPSASNKEYEDLIFVLANEFGWTQEDIWNTDIPYIFSVLNAKLRFTKEQERRIKKSQKGK